MPEREYQAIRQLHLFETMAEDPPSKSIFGPFTAEDKRQPARDQTFRLPLLRRTSIPHSIGDGTNVLFVGLRCSHSAIV